MEIGVNITLVWMDTRASAGVTQARKIIGAERRKVLGDSDEGNWCEHHSGVDGHKNVCRCDAGAGKLLAHNAGRSWVISFAGSPRGEEGGNWCEQYLRVGWKGVVGGDADTGCVCGCGAQERRRGDTDAGPVCDCGADAED